MRVRPLVHLLPLLLAACGGAGAPSAPAAPPAWPIDGFLRLLPESPSVVVRLPTTKGRADSPLAHAALLRMLGLKHPVEAFDGLDAARAPGYAAFPGGASARYLPAADKSRLNRALSALATRVAIREEGDWVVLEEGAPPRAAKDVAGGDPLPPGDVAVRVLHHPLLQLFAYPGDRLDAGLALADGGIEIRGRFRPAPEGESARLIAAARPADGGLVDLLPGSLALRVETGLPATAFASFVATRLAVHCGVKEKTDRVLIERLLREALSGARSDGGFAFGLEILGGEASFVLLGRSGEGPPSPVLAKVRAGHRWSAGAWVVDRREVSDLTALSLWVAAADPALDGAPETAWPLIGALSDERGLPLAYGEVEGWFVFAGGRRADTLARAVKQRLAGETTRSDGGSTLMAMRESGKAGKGDYLIGVVYGGQGATGLAPADRAVLPALFGATADAIPPHCAAIAGFRDGDSVSLRGRLLYSLE